MGGEDFSSLVALLTIVNDRILTAAGEIEKLGREQGRGGEKINELLMALRDVQHGINRLTESMVDHRRDTDRAGDGFEKLEAAIKEVREGAIQRGVGIQATMDEIRREVGTIRDLAQNMKTTVAARGAAPGEKKKVSTAAKVAIVLGAALLGSAGFWKVIEVLVKGATR